MDGHSDDTADGAGDEGDSGLTIVCHVKYCRGEKRMCPRWICGSDAIRNK